MSGFEFVFLADCQLGAYATFSGMSDDDIAGFVERDMRVAKVPRVEGFAWDADRYREAVAAVNRIAPAFAVMGGDMIDDPASEAQYESLMEITAGLDSDIRMYWVPGNHDVAADTVVPTAASIARYREAFGPDFYAFDHGEVRFIVLNTVVIDHPEASGGALDEQLDFMAWEVERLRRDGRQGIAFGHHPLFVESVDEVDTYWNLPLERRRQVREAFRVGRIRHAFAGHWHRNSIARDGDLEMVTSGPVGYPLGDDPSGLRRVRVHDGQVTHRYHALTEFEEGTG